MCTLLSLEHTKIKLAGISCGHSILYDLWSTVPLSWSVRKWWKGHNSAGILGQFVLHKWESDHRTEKGNDWKWYDK